MIYYWSVQSWIGLAPLATHHYLHIEDEHSDWILHMPCATKMEALLELKRLIQVDYPKVYPGVKLLPKWRKYL